MYARTDKESESKSIERMLTLYEKLLDVLWIDGQIKTCRGGALGDHWGAMQAWRSIRHVSGGSSMCRTSSSTAGITGARDCSRLETTSIEASISSKASGYARERGNSRGTAVRWAATRIRHGGVIPPGDLVRPWSTPSAGQSARRLALHAVSALDSAESHLPQQQRQAATTTTRMYE